MRSFIGRVLRPFVEALAEKLPQPRCIYDRDGRSPYLTRYYLTKRPTMPDGSDPFTSEGNPKPDVRWPQGFGVYLHHFHRSDNDGALHNHPWAWAFSFILVGGYQEERRVGMNVEERTVLPLSFNWIDKDTFHRVDLRERDAWSIFVVGPKTDSWGFWERETGHFTPWREFIDDRRKVNARNKALDSVVFDPIYDPNQRFRQ